MLQHILFLGKKWTSFLQIKLDFFDFPSYGETQLLSGTSVQNLIRKLFFVPQASYHSKGERGF